MKTKQQIDAKEAVLKIFETCDQHLLKVCNEAVSTHDAMFCVKLRKVVKNLYVGSAQALEKLDNYLGIRSENNE